MARRLHSAIGFITPADTLRGRRQRAIESSKPHARPAGLGEPLRPYINSLQQAPAVAFTLNPYTTTLACAVSAVTTVQREDLRISSLYESQRAFPRPHRSVRHRKDLSALCRKGDPPAWGRRQVDLSNAMKLVCSGSDK